MRYGVVALLMAVLAASAFGVTLVLQPDGAAGVDVGAYQAVPGSNYGTNQYLMQNYGNAYECRAYLSFDLSSISGASVTLATFDLWVGTGVPNPTNYNFGIYRVTSSWTETGLTWNNQPTYNTSAYDTKLVTGAAGSQTTWTITTLIQQWVLGTYTNYGLVVCRVDMSNQTPWPYLVSSDYGTANMRPRLTITYTSVGVAPTSLGRIKSLYQ
jgi:hypothetical protein